MNTLLAIRLSMNLSQTEVAKQAGISVAAYWRAENGENVHVQTARKICKVFNVETSAVENLNIAPRRLKKLPMV